jgi:hypothetical protein
MDYDSTADTLRHSLRVGSLMGQPIDELRRRSVEHDLSKTRDPELAVFNEYTPKLKDSTYGSDEYKGYLAAMGEGLAHHYAVNRHHPEHFADGIDGMTLVDLIEMLADWKAATERHTAGSLLKSLDIQRQRFDMSNQLWRILWNTARRYGWIDVPCGAVGHAPNGDRLECNVQLDRPGRHFGPHADGSRDCVDWPNETVT